MGDIRWTAEAQIWLKDIFDYISLDNLKAARIVIEGIVKRVKTLKRLPEQGHKYFRYPELNIRVLLYGHYRIVYLIKSNRDIDILGIFHTALDMDKYFF